MCDPTKEVLMVAAAIIFAGVTAAIGGGLIILCWGTALNIVLGA
jgi:hypothetical protein